MKFPKKSPQALLIMVAALQLTACARTVRWEEEVLLNTGETIWVSKEVRYAIRGESANPLDLGYRPSWLETTTFKYGGRSYSYTGEAGIIVLAISPQRLPVLIAPAAQTNWHEHHNYPCVNPYYVQLIPDASGRRWSWPDRIEPWTYNLPTNLMLHRDDLLEVRQRYTMADKSKQTELQDPRLSYIQKIDPSYISDTCNRSNQS